MLIVLVYAALVMAAIAVLGNLFLRKWNDKRRDSRIEERVSAYAAMLEREEVPVPLQTLSDAELRSDLRNAARRVQAESDKRFYIAVLGGIVAFFVALGFAIEGEGTRDFVITLLVAGIALYGINVFLARRFRARYAEKGIDVDRLRVD